MPFLILTVTGNDDRSIEWMAPALLPLPISKKPHDTSKQDKEPSAKQTKEERE